MFSAALRLATFLLVPEPSAVWFPTFTYVRKTGLGSVLRIKTRQERKKTQNDQKLEGFTVLPWSWFPPAHESAS